MSATAERRGRTLRATLRDRLFGVAYRMTGSVADAEDCVQEAFVRWQRTDIGAVDHDEAFLVRTVSRLTIDRQRQAARRRETYVTVAARTPPGSRHPARHCVGRPRDEQLADSLSFAFLVMLDRLSASSGPRSSSTTCSGCRSTRSRPRSSASRRRAASWPAGPVASSATPTGARTAAPRPVVGTDAANALGALLGALLTGDVEACLHHLAPGVVLTSDAGPHRRAARRHVVGADQSCGS